MKTIDKTEFRFWKTMAVIVDCFREKATEQCVSQEAFDMSIRQGLVMKKVSVLTANEPEGIPLKKLAEELHLTPGTVSEVVDTMVRKGGLDRIINPNDRRAVMIRLTAKSQSYIDSINEKITEMSKNLLSDFSEEEKAALVATLEKLQIKLNKTLKKD